MATNFMVKMDEIGRLTFIDRLGIPKWSKISQFRFKSSICYDLDTPFKNLVNFGTVTSKFKKDKDVHPIVYQQFGYAAPLLYLVGVSTVFPLL